MDFDIQSFLAWAAPIASTVIVTFLTAQINLRTKREEEKRTERQAENDARRKKEAEWRERVEERLDEQDEKIQAILSAQCTQIRSDVTHKIHRYVDDLKAASTEEKQSLWVEYEEYCAICEKYGIENHFVEQMVQQVMKLPDRRE